MQKHTPDNVHLYRPEPLITRRLVGYPTSLLQTVLAAAFFGRPILLRGRHGTGKTCLFQLLANALGHDTSATVRYDASKDDLMTVAGMPNVEKLQHGELVFAEHQRCIYQKTIVLIDELTRSSFESANMWYEIIEERTLFGRALDKLVNIVAACNPATGYGAAEELDLALLDRFFVVVDVPDLRDATPKSIEAVVARNMEADLEAAQTLPPASDIEAFRTRLLQRRMELAMSSELRGVIANWCACFTKVLMDHDQVYVSPRTFGRQLPALFLDLLAYLSTTCATSVYEVVYETAEYAAQFCVQTKCHIDDDSFTDAVETARHVLREWIDRHSELGDVDRLGIGSVEERMIALETITIGEIEPSVLPHIRHFMLHILSEHASSESLIRRLMNALAPLPELLAEVELFLLNKRLDWIASDAIHEDEQRVDWIGTNATKDDAFWAPATTWEASK